MGRIEKSLGESAAALSADELLALLASQGEADLRAREIAIACYLSGSEGWRDALKQLGGAFAEEPTGLKQSKAD